MARTRKLIRKVKKQKDYQQTRALFSCKHSSMSQGKWEMWCKVHVNWKNATCHTNHHQDTAAVIPMLNPFPQLNNNSSAPQHILSNSNSWCPFLVRFTSWLIMYGSLLLSQFLVQTRNVLLHPLSGLATSETLATPISQGSISSGCISSCISCISWTVLLYRCLWSILAKQFT